MIILVTYKEKDPSSPYYNTEMVSHGMDSETLQNICLPDEPVRHMGKFNQSIGEWVLK